MRVSYNPYAFEINLIKSALVGFELDGFVPTNM